MVLEAWPRQQGFLQCLFKRSLLEFMTERLSDGRTKLCFNREIGMEMRWEHKESQQEVGGSETERVAGEEDQGAGVLFGRKHSCLCLDHEDIL